jgi:C1A family cysteine protease
MAVKKYTGAKASTLDSRDFKFVSNSQIPDAYFSPLGAGYTTIQDQKKLGVCTMVSLVKYVEHLYFKKTGVYTRLSVRFAYTMMKNLIDADGNEGSSMRNALKTLMVYGTCKEEIYPTDYTLSHSDFISMSIPNECFEQARNYKIFSYYSVPTDKSLVCGAIYNHDLVYARYEVDKQWYSPTTLSKDICPLRPPIGQGSGHAVLLSGYNIKDNYRTSILNSWGDKWASDGIGFTYFDNIRPTEAWVVSLNVTTPVLSPIKDTRTVSDSVWRSALDILRKIGIMR